ncbi:transposase [Francisella sp. 19X1-34]|uniref:transposase n=1 Tax=Francisella sp. 19X1-34 TaxID=3087177 RepID=UPI002E342029|nr:transposase [Francisella sp. 19X1-34]MED7789586.1 transposase [Francisella sp. 19X1-34]
MIKITPEMQPKRLAQDSKKKLITDCIRTTPVTQLANQHNVSRNTIYTQLNTIEKKMHQTLDNNTKDVIYHIPVTKKWISSTIALLFMICKSSIRDTISFIKYAVDMDVSSGYVSSILDQTTSKATEVNNSYDLSNCKNSATDEIFHQSQPVLTSIDLDSQFCMELKLESNRDHNTWGYHLLNMIDRGYCPENNIMDGGSGMKKAFEEVLPDVNIRYDHFHIIKNIKDTSRYLKNQYESAMTECIKLSIRLDKKQCPKIKYKLQKATKIMTEKEFIHNQFTTLTNWLQYDILQLQSICHKDRIELYDFILEELDTLAKRHPHRIKCIHTTLKNNKDSLLNIVHELNRAFDDIAKKYSINISDVWDICNNARYNIHGDKYNINIFTFYDKYGEIFEDIEDDVLETISRLHRSSSLIENINSRIRVYLDPRKGFKEERFELIKFALNHLPRRRAANQKLKGKSAAEVFTDKDNIDFMALLGLHQFKRVA